jgi:hypothetical protein
MGTATHYENGEAQYDWRETDALGWYRGIDLLSASIEETPSSLRFTFEVADFESEQATPSRVGFTPYFEEWVRGVTFDLEGQPYTVGVIQDPFGGDMVLASLYDFSFPGVGNYYFPDFRTVAPAVPLESSAGWTGEIEKRWLRTPELIPLREGHVLENIRMFASNTGFSGAFTPCPDADTASPGSPPRVAICTATVVDDSGTEPIGRLEVVETPPGVGHIFMRMQAPYRFSNGLATTYLFEAQVYNLEAMADDVVLQVSEIPPGWDVRAPAIASFEGAGMQTIPIAVTVPFSHQHGSNHLMSLTAVSQLNQSAAIDQPFGVIFADPPQPAGHHNTLWFHAEDPCGEDFAGGQGCPRLYMNAAQDPEPLYRNSRWVDEVSSGSGVMISASNPAAPAKAFWDVRLAPSLRVGLELDAAKEGTLKFALRTGYDWTARIDAEVVLYDFASGSHTQLLQGSITDVALAAGTAKSIDITMIITADKLRYSPAPGQGLLLRINATDESGLPGNAKPGNVFFITDESTLSLPLLDFHEDVDLAGLEFSNLQIDRISERLKAVNPGKTTVFEFNVTNLGTGRATLDWTIAGPDHFVGWAKAAPSTSHLKANSSGVVIVRADVPKSAVDGETAELLLVGTSRQDANVQVFGRLVVAVREGADIPDEATAANALVGDAVSANDKQKESPGPGLLAALAALGLLVRRRR